MKRSFQGGTLKYRRLEIAEKDTREYTAGRKLKTNENKEKLLPFALFDSASYSSRALKKKNKKNKSNFEKFNIV